MPVTTCARAPTLTACIALMVPAMALSASFSDIASGTKNLTEAAKDVNDISKSNYSETQQAPAKAPPAPAKKTKKQRAPQGDNVRGG